MTESGSVTIVTQTCVRPERADDFGRWQAETSAVVARFPGFVEQQLLLPKNFNGYMIGLRNIIDALGVERVRIPSKDR